MDIWATGDSWAFGMGLGGFKYAVDKKTRDLSLVLDNKAEYKRDSFMVQTGRGIFIETLVDGEVVQSGGDGNWYYITLGKKPTILRYKKLPDPELSAPEIEKNRQSVKRWLVDDQPCGAGVPDTLVGLIGWAEKLLKKIPEKSREAARCSFDTSSSYGETYPQVEVTYSEPETDEEVIARVKIERERGRIAGLEKRAQFDKLKREFEPSK